MTAELTGLELRKALCEALGIDKPKTPDLTICAVVWDKISCTGQTFHFYDGRTFDVPDGDTLPPPEGSIDFNDRYALFIGMQLPERELASAIAAYRVPVARLPALESDPGVFWPEFEKWRCSFKVNKPGFKVIDECGNDKEPYYQFTIEGWSSEWRGTRATSNQSITEAGCRAWLKALEAVYKERQS